MSDASIEAQDLRTEKDQAASGNHGGGPAKRQRTEVPQNPSWWKEEWTQSTNSINLFQPEDQTREDLQSYLEEKDVVTLGNLHEKLQNHGFWALFLSELADLGMRFQSNFLMGLHPFLDKRVRVDVATKLDKSFLVEGSAGLPTHAIVDGLFNKEFEKINQTRNTAKLRGEDFPPIIVSGSSGSGKTTFAGITLPKLQRNVASTKLFSVFIKGSVATNNRRTKDMAKTTCNHIYRLLEKEGIDGSIFPLQGIEMLVIIDEMEIDEDKDYLGSGDKLGQITAELRKIAATVQLVLVGTGIDKIATSVNTETEGCKIAVKPWTVSNLLAFAKVMDLSDVNVLNLLEQEEAFGDLGSNARAARFLVTALKKFSTTYTPHQRAELIDVVIKEVAYEYINSSGLASCSIEKRRYVAKVVLTVLQSVKKGKTDYVFKCDDLDVRRVAVGLMDFHVETKNGVERLCGGEEFAVTVSPAITIVLSALMGAIETFSSTWEGLERVGALDALGRLFIESELPVPEMSIVRARSPFPATNAKTEVKVPIIGKNTILLNGTGAPHADIISTYTFRQFKRSTSTLASLDIETELSKMGVMGEGWYKAKAEEAVRCLKAKNQQQDIPAKEITAARHKAMNLHKASRLMTRELIKLWNKGDVTASNNVVDTTSKSNQGALPSTLQDNCKRHMYPFGQLQVKKEVKEVKFETHRIPEELGHNLLNQVLPEGKKIIVVFATNSSGFVLSSKQNLKITCDRVDDEGRPTESKDTFKCYLSEHLDQNKVDVRFQMCAY